MWFDEKVTWNVHINKMEDKCKKILNVMRCISGREWGADRVALKTIYSTMIRTVLDYGCIAYGTATKSQLGKLERIQSRALRICCGAYPSSPVSALQVEMGEMPIHLRRKQLILAYWVNLKGQKDSHPTKVSPEKHSLHCLFTGLSTPDTFSGSVFSGLCVYDDIKIIHYSNEEQDWKIKSQNAEIRGHLKLYKDWFQFYPKNLLLQVNILSNCTNYKCSELHLLQRRAGCDVEKLNGTIKYLTVFNEYQYDGEDFIAFNFNTTQWINTNPKAKETKLKWDSQTTRNHVIKDQLKICMNWISTFNNTQRTLPDVEVFAVESPQDQNKLILTCLATGFYPKHLEMNMMLNGIKLDHINSSGIRPNGDETFQLRISVEIHRNETEGFECHVNHISVKEPVISEWDGKCRNCSEASRTNIITIIIAAVTFTVFMIVIFIYIHKKKRSNVQLNCNESDRREKSDSEKTERLNAADSPENDSPNTL
ncbi:zinc-alpha-2-glycoprotein-like isoform X2 [Xyrauchen texanus]|uniref:zinc-alpha-2-glycoprotein-like isoform X2 n=1 Tax=Xyrauchen texanus TaxID=154827 RepID=UPI002242BB10|nr:zinc-alpha-2-glycoprotein-like isoform X2 [Xyrauchen texanus]